MQEQFLPDFGTNNSFPASCFLVIGKFSEFLKGRRLVLFSLLLLLPFPTLGGEKPVERHLFFPSF